MNKLALILIMTLPAFCFGQGFKPMPKFSEQNLDEVTLTISDKFSFEERSASTTTLAPVSNTWTVPGTIPSNTLIDTRVEASKIFGMTKEDQLAFVLDKIQTEKRSEDASLEFVMNEEKISKTGSHVSYLQEFKGLPVFGGAVKVHLNDEKGLWALGRISQVPSELSATPSVSSEQALKFIQKSLHDELAWTDLSETQLQYIPNNTQASADLIVFHDEKDIAHLTWQYTLHPTVRTRYEVFVDAHDGTIVHYFASHCQLWHGMGEASCSASHHIADAAPAALPTTPSSLLMPGPETATAQDLFNINRNINVWRESNTYYMIDASRAMFNGGQSSFPDDAKGVVWTLDGGNNSPENSNFQVSHVANGNNVWTDKVAVSAHYHGGVAYEYFRSVHGRNSINGQGGNVISLVNITEADGSGMDNAFWNGAYMFYGNGNQAFNAPLAKGLDVAGHELSHGVIQNEANLVYQKQPGALNESFADIFGAMIDRDDWTIGEDISNPSVFPSGSMRSMQDPNNGGNSNNFYWQPKHMNEFKNLPNTQQGDWGGVHINSGIPNHAYYLFATEVGKDKAEDVYYEVLTNYLTASSQFVDLRLAVVDVAESMFGATVKAAAETAFSQVGIGDGPGNDNQQDDDVNPGDEIILWADGSQIGLLFSDNSTMSLSTTPQASRPSITDDGTVVVFIDNSNRIKVIEIDYTNLNNPEEYFLENNPQTIWRNISISKNGSRLSILTTDNDNELLIYDFGQQSLVSYELENPTTSNPNTGQTINTGDVRYADVMEWDISGEFVMYDAFNEVSGTFGEEISYWDIGLVKVWNNNGDDFSDGAITKIFNGLQENESVGNPTFSKNSPYIIAFDYINTDNFGNSEFTILGSNLETGDIGTIFENATLGYPSFSPDDDELLFSAQNSNGDDILATIPMAADKINAGGAAAGLVAGPIWGLWFANGDRPAVAIKEQLEDKAWAVWPNPNDGVFTLQWEADFSEKEATYQIIDLMGRVVQSGDFQGRSTQVEMALLPAGSYWISIKSQAQDFGSRKLIKH